MLLAQQNFCTFPVLFRGSASVITTCCGHLKRARLPSQRACTADNFKASPLIVAMIAQPTSPHFWICYADDGHLTYV